MKNTTSIGLDRKQSSHLAEKLNVLLANYSVFYQNARGFHWNLKGDTFFELHVKFEELYNYLILKIDDIAERILTLGYEAEYKFSSYAELSTIKEAKQSDNGIKSIEDILKSFQVLIVLQRELLEVAGEAKDEGTGSMMSDNIREQEKMVWMYDAYLGKR